MTEEKKDIKPLHEQAEPNPFSISKSMEGWGESEIGMIAMAKKGEETKKLMGVT
jgi:hypothetical protein